MLIITAVCEGCHAIAAIEIDEQCPSLADVPVQFHYLDWVVDDGYPPENHHFCPKCCPAHG